MARRIEGVSDQLLRCAREEFMEMGFQEASMRVIAAKANTSTGPSIRATATNPACSTR